MITSLVESILEAYYQYIIAIGEKRGQDADQIYEKINLLLNQEPQDSKLFIPFIEMYDYIAEYSDNYEALGAYYNDLVYEFKKIKYPDRYKDTN